MQNALHPVALALKEGDKPAARRLLAPILKHTPSADAWYLAAHATDDRAGQIKCLKKALALDEWHSKADRMLTTLQAPPPLVELAPEPVFERGPDAANTPDDLLAIRDKPGARRGGRLRRAGCVVSLLGMTVMSLLTLALTGFIPGGVGVLEQITGGPPPVEEVDGVPITDNPNAIYMLEPSQSQPARTQQQDAIDHGYLHEYTFEAGANEEIVIFVQFLSVDAGNVAAHVAVVDPNGTGVNQEICRDMGDQGFVNGESNVTYQCIIDIPGTWAVRILGIRGATTGTYFLGVESLTDLSQ